MVDTNHRYANDMILVEQFVNAVQGFSSQYGSDVSISYTAYNVTGKPSKYPDYGDFPQAFVMRTYGNWWKQCPSSVQTIMSQSLGKYDSQDFIDLEFEQAVYPIQLQIYETFNPGAVIRIWAGGINNAKWKLLWEGEPENVGHRARIFSPELKCINFPTRLVRLEFHHLHLEYYTELDAVLLLGSRQPPGDAEYQYNRNIPTTGKLTSQILQLNIHNIPAHIDIPNTISNFLGKDFPLYVSQVKDVHSSSSKQATVYSGKDFRYLSDEMVLKIFGYLDLVSLCRCAQVSKHFYNLTNDSLLYVELNLKLYWYCTTPEVLNVFTKKCQYLQKLDLSWCGSPRILSSQHFINFVLNCGKLLTHLRVNSCLFIDDSCVKTISKICKNLRELSLQNCVNVSVDGFHNLTFLQNLKYLNLYRTMIELGVLQEILQALPCLQHINLGCCVHVSNMDEVAMTLGASNPELVSADFWKIYSLTPVGVRALSQCHKLEEVDLGWCLGFGAPGDCLYALARGCPRLKKLFFAALRGIADRDLEPFIDFCPQLEQIDLLGVQSISSELCDRILRTCNKLTLLDLSFCDQILETQVTLWRHMYPAVNIKRSFQNPTDQLSNQILLNL